MILLQCAFDIPESVYVGFFVWPSGIGEATMFFFVGVFSLSKVRLFNFFLAFFL